MSSNSRITFPPPGAKHPHRRWFSAVFCCVGLLALAPVLLERGALAQSEAEGSYRLGREHLRMRTQADVEQALELFERAIAADADHAPAHAGLADALALLYEYPRAEQAALRALELDESLAEAHASLAFIRMHAHWDWAQAEAHFKRALELDPEYAAAHHWYAVYLEIMGRSQAAVEEARRALELEPRSTLYSVNLGYRLFWARRYEAAIAQLRSTLEMDPFLGSAYYFLGRCHVETGQFEPAMAAFDRAAKLEPRNKNIRAALGYLHARRGRRREAERVLKALVAESRPPAAHIASIHAALGRTDEALDWLDRGLATREVAVAWLKVDPRFDPLRSDERFQALLRALGVADRQTPRNSGRPAEEEPHP